MSSISRTVFVILLVVLIQPVRAQDKVLLTEKPGTFRIRQGILNGLSMDLYGKESNFSASEAEAALNELEELVHIFRQCPVLKEIKGFDADCDLGAGRYSSKYGFGVPSTLTFYLRTWSLYKGKEAQWIIEPPQWRMEINMTDKYRDNGFNESDFSNAYNPTNQDFSEEAMRSAVVEVNELFYQPGIRETITPGIDRYGDTYVIYNPDRPPYWEQVTIREAYRLLINYWKCVPDKSQSDVFVPMLNKELSGFTEEEKDSYAYFGNPESVYRIVPVKNGTPVMRSSPEYWNMNLPRSAIQIMVFETPDDATVKNKMENCYRGGDGYYYIYRLLDELEIRSLQSVISR